MSLASLPMYNPPEAAGASADLWRGLARHVRRAGLTDVPDELTVRPDLPGHWLSPDLLFSQTCGYPLTHALSGGVRLLATPCYDAPGCEGPSYCSILVVPAESPAVSPADLRGKRAAFNTSDSQSGMNALRAVIAPLAEGGRFFAETIETGGHAASLELVAAGGADVAAIDSVSLALFLLYRRPAMGRVRELCRSPAAPSLPFITAGGAGHERILRLRDALRAAMADPDLAGARQALLLRDIMLLPDSAYQPILEMEQTAQRQGYPILA
jgi:ABC-type phosphate/phosphonate transport system substrate-binding protein